MESVKENKISYGLSSTSTVEEVIVRHDGTATRYKVTVGVIDLAALRQEKEMLEEQLEMPKPSNETLIEDGKMVNPYYTEREEWERRLVEIGKALDE